jgi:hypothetical protein
MKTKIVGALIAALALTACSAENSDSKVTSSALPAPESSGSEMQFELSETATAVSIEVIGMTEAEAIATIEGVSSEQLTYRVIRRDGESYPMTMDYRLDRINLEIDNGVVTKASIG